MSFHTIFYIRQTKRIVYDDMPFVYDNNPGRWRIDGTQQRFNELLHNDSLFKKSNALGKPPGRSAA